MPDPTNNLNSFAPPNADTLDMTLPAPADSAPKYNREHGTEEWYGTNRLMGYLAAKGDLMLPLEVARPEFVKAVRIPDFHDKDKVWDEGGNLMFDVDGKPLTWQAMGLVPKAVRKAGQTGVLTDVEGKVLVKVDPNDQKQTMGVRLGTAIYATADRRYNFMGTDAAANAEFKKILADVTGNGPDEKYRLLYAEWNEDGKYFQKYGGKPLTATETAWRNKLIKTAMVSPGYILATAEYEIRKREEQRQAGDKGAWLSVYNTLHKTFNVSPNGLMSIQQGLVFGYKTQYLFEKHTPFKYVRDDGSDFVDAQGKPIDITKVSRKQFNKYREEGSRVVLGELNERDYVTELTDKFKAGDMQFSPASIQQTIDLTIEIGRRLDMAQTISVMNRRNYQNAAWLIQKLYTGISGTRNAMEADAEKLAKMTPMEQHQYNEQVDRMNAQYGAQIYSSGGGKERWKALAAAVDDIAKRHSIVKNVGEFEYRRDGQKSKNVRVDNNP